MAIAYKGTEIVTPVGNLYYGFVKKGQPRDMNPKSETATTPKLGYTMTLCLPATSEAATTMRKMINDEWRKFLALNPKVTGAPSKFPIKEEMKDSPTGEKDEYGAIVKVPTGNVFITFKTMAQMPDGKPKFVKIYNAKGTDVTEDYAKAEYTIGNESEGRIYGTLKAGSHNGSTFISCYLNVVQVSKLSRYTYDVVVDEIEGDTDDDFSSGFDSKVGTDSGESINTEGVRI